MSPCDRCAESESGQPRSELAQLIRKPHQQHVWTHRVAIVALDAITYQAVAVAGVVAGVKRWLDC